jgi:hypothetical protein
MWRRRTEGEEEIYTYIVREHDGIKLTVFKFVKVFKNRVGHICIPIIDTYSQFTTDPEVPGSIPGPTTFS